MLFRSGVDVIEADGIVEEIQNRIEGCPCRGFLLEKIDLHILFFLLE